MTIKSLLMGIVVFLNKWDFCNVIKTNDVVKKNTIGN